MVEDNALARAVGASDQDFGELNEMVSVPLGWINHWFIVRPDSSALKVVVILIANSYFYALLLFPVMKFVYRRLQRNRPIILNLDGSMPEESDEDEIF
jgi:hypothetical protein